MRELPRHGESSESVGEILPGDDLLVHRRRFECWRGARSSTWFHDAFQGRRVTRILARKSDMLSLYCVFWLAVTAIVLVAPSGLGPAGEAPRPRTETEKPSRFRLHRMRRPEDPALRATRETRVRTRLTFHDPGVSRPSAAYGHEDASRSLT